MAAVLENIDAVDEKLVQEMMVVLMDNLERRFGGKQPEQQAEPEQPAANRQSGPKTPDLNSYFSEPTRKTDTRTPDIDNYFN